MARNKVRANLLVAFTRFDSGLTVGIPTPRVVRVFEQADKSTVIELDMGDEHVKEDVFTVLSRLNHGGLT